jgi:glycerol-3-phosphate dehydrogenase
MTIGDFDQNWDLVIIGGGITGAGILREAVGMGLRALLVEQRDFAWGTSSRSAKLVHGGLRYLQQGHLLLTRESVMERERLLIEAPGLVEPLWFHMPVCKGRGPGRGKLGMGLSVYDLLSHKWRHKYYGSDDFLSRVPPIRQDGLIGGYAFFDAQVDDARLVLRLIDEAIELGGHALNYTAATEIVRDATGTVFGVAIQDVETAESRILRTSAVVNATGTWAEKLHPSPDPKLRLRPLRGSHLVFPRSALPLNHALGLLHPVDRRWVFAVPWEGVVLFGTTDVDHKDDLSKEPVITPEEVTYLLEALHAWFPSLTISEEDCISTFAGIRPVLSEGKRAASEESREHAVWVKDGLVTVTGGKLTTFRTLGRDTIKAVKPFLKSVKLVDDRSPTFSVNPEPPNRDLGLPDSVWRRLSGRYGRGAGRLVESAAPEDLELIPDTFTIWAEIPYAAKHERIRHLGDLMLRRVRLGLLTPHGAKELLGRVRSLCEPVLPWDDNRWEQEIRGYLDLWGSVHAPPDS